MLRVTKVEGEATCFFVESAEAQCSNPECARLYRRLPKMAVSFTNLQKKFLQYYGLLGKVEKALAKAEAGESGRQPGDHCPRCGAALSERFHKVDISSYAYNGKCGCEAFAFGIEPTLSRLPEEEWSLGMWRCQHIDAARNFALDLALHAHAKEQAKPGKKPYYLRRAA